VATTALKQHGLLVTRGHVLENLPLATTVLLDKTGTLTEARLSLQETRALRPGVDPQALLDVAAAIESRSEHPLASAFRDRPGPLPAVQAWRSVAARGLEAQVAGRRYRIGTAAFVAELAAQPAPDVPGTGRWLLLGDEDGPLLWIRLGDPLRPSAAAMVAELKNLGLRTILLSGDRHSEVERIAAEVAVDEFHAEATPESKLAILKDLQARGEHVIMVGDGINDLPVQAGADVSVAVAEAADVGKARADCLLLSGQLTVLADAVRKARQTRRIVRENLGWALSYNLTAIPFAAMGLVPPWLAAIGMSASSLVVVGNARRLRRWKASTS
jgi:Cu2+-exporting ATPase